MKEIELRFAVYYTAQEFYLAARLLSEGHVDPRLFIAARGGFGTFDETFAALARGDLMGKYLVEPSLLDS